MKISQCMIVKNEAHNLQRSLGNLRGIVDEQIVIDTGSTDNTVEVAEALGATVYHFKWINDFAAAKNFAIEKATGDWIVFLDADEHFDFKDAKKLRDIIEGAQKAKMVAITMTLANIESTGKLMGTGKQSRIFRNRKDIRYHGKIHEALISKRSDFKSYNAPNITIWHTGYDRQIAQDRDKGNRNLELLIKEFENNEENYMLLHYIGESYVMLENKNEALKYFYRIRDHYPDASPHIRLTTHTNILHTLSKLDISTKNAEYDFQKAIEEFNDIPDFYLCIGIIYEKNKEIDKAIQSYEYYSRLNEIKRDRTVDRSIGLLTDVQVQLLKLYILNKDLVNAVKQAILLLQYDKYDYKTLYSLLKILLEKEKTCDIIMLIKKIYNFNSVKEKYFLYRLMKDNELIELQKIMEAYFNESEKKDLNI